MDKFAEIPFPAATSPKHYKIVTLKTHATNGIMTTKSIITLITMKPL